MASYKIKKSKGGSSEHSYNTYAVTVPRPIAEAILARDPEMRFECELTEDGILYRPTREQPNNVTTPSWLQGGVEEND